MKATGRPIGHEEIRRAVRKFREEGGIITRLPPQEVAREAILGSRWVILEPVSGLATALGLNQHSEKLGDLFTESYAAQIQP